jgi:hypothetical protein
MSGTATIARAARTSAHQIFKLCVLNIPNLPEKRSDDRTAD